SFSMVPVNYRLTAQEIARQLKDCHAAAFIHSPDYQLEVKQSDLSSKLCIICVQTNTLGLSAIDEQKCTKTLNEAKETDTFYLGYTSGTTGTPKGAIITQRNRALAFHYWSLAFGIKAEDVYLHCGPFHHTAPLTFALTQLFI